MKIALISPNVNNLHELARVLEAGSHSVLRVDSGKAKLHAVAQQEAPDLILVDGMAGEAHELGPIESVTTQYPKLAIILVCASITPDFLIAAMRAGVREVLPSPAPAAALDAAVQRIASKITSTHAATAGRILAFMPCKGGSGATFLATNLGYQLAEDRNVLLIDLNLQFGDALSFLHDGQPASTLGDIAHEIRRLDASFLDACAVKIKPNYSILAAPADPGQAVGIKPEHIDAILELAVAQYDFVLLDLPRSLDTLTIKALDRAYRIYPVLQASVPGLRHAKKLAALFQSLGYPYGKIEFIINRFDKRSEIDMDDVRRLLGTITLRTVPNAYKDVRASIDHGHALIQAARSSPVVRSLRDVALGLVPDQQESRGLFSRFFKRNADGTSLLGAAGPSSGRV